MNKNGILIIILSCLTLGLHAQEERTFWDNGNLKSITNHDEDDEKVGYWEEYFESGERKEYGSYESGKKSGTWYEYYHDGTNKKRTSYRNGLISDLETYYENGRNMVTGRFDDDEKKDGRWMQYYNNWQQKLEGDYDHGKKQGQWKHYTETGELFKVENYKEGVRISKWEGANENSYDNTIKDAAADAIGEAMIQDVEVEIIEVEDVEVAQDVSNEVVEAAVDAVIEAAEDTVIEARSYYGNRLNGQWKFYNESGQVVEIGFYINDKKDGKWTYYYDNGQIKKELIWKEDKLMEVVSYFDEKGKAYDKGTLKNGNGAVTEYDADRKLISNIEYISGEKIDWNNWSMLNTLAWNIYEDETGEDNLQNGIKLVKRSIELDKNYYNTDTYAALLFKTGKYKQALSSATEAIKIAKKEGETYSSTTELIEQINKKIKK